MSKSRRNRKGTSTVTASVSNADSGSNITTNWKRNVLAHAIAVAGAGVPGVVSASCHTAPITGARTTTCTIEDGESVTVTSTGSITTTGGDDAVEVTSSATGISLTNDGAISADNTTGPATAIDVLNDLDGSIADTGSVSATSTAGTGSETAGAGTAYGIDLNDLDGTLDNSGTVSATATGGSAEAAGIFFGSVGGVIPAVEDDPETTETDESSPEIAAGSLNNSGSISASATATTEGASAAGIISSEGEIAGSVTNSGDISASAEAGNFAYAAGVLLEGGVAETGSVSNSGTITATADTTEGFSAIALGLEGTHIDGTLDNSGAVTASASAGGFAGAAGIGTGDINGAVSNSGSVVANAAASSTAFAYGIVGDDINGTLDNSGSIEASASAEFEGQAVGIGFNSIAGAIAAVEDDPETTATDESAPAVAGGSLTNSGSVDAMAAASGTAQATGIGMFEGEQEMAGAIDNSGTVSASASADSSARARGIALEGDITGTGSVNNSGTLSVTAEADFDAEAIGIDLSSFEFEGGLGNGNVDGTIDNSGGITVAASGSSAEARGIDVGDINGSVNNSGTITATATATDDEAEADGISADDVTGTLTNSGSISVNASGASSASASGIEIDDLEGTLDNSGSVTAVAVATSEYATAEGIDVDDISGTLINSGTVSASAQGSYSAYAEGIDSDDISGQLTNSGSVTATATASSSAEATGITGGDIQGVLENSGSVVATASGEDYPEATGILVDSIEGAIAAIADDPETTATDESEPAIAAGSVINSGSVTATATGDYEVESTGIRVQGGLDGGMAAVEDDPETTATDESMPAVMGGSLTNSGSIQASATAMTESAEAYGIEVSEGTITGAITNSGSISANATGVDYATAYGIAGNDDITASGSITNSGSIVAGAIANNTNMGSESGSTASAYAYGLYGYVIDGTIDNSGTISASAQADDFATAIGIYHSTIGETGSVTNSGEISASATATGSATAWGVYVYDITGSFSNSGSITASASAETDGAEAYGVQFSDLTGTMDNAGEISATAASTGLDDAYAAGIYVESTIYDEGALTNSGEISATASVTVPESADLGFEGSIELDADATGIRVDDDFEGNASITNSGMITATATASSLIEEVEEDEEGEEPLAELLLDADAIGISLYEFGEDNEGEPTGVTLTNTASGEIVATATGTHDVEAMGIEIRSSGFETGSTLLNQGEIAATATSTVEAQASGIVVGEDFEGEVNGQLINEGGITASATGTSEVQADGILIGDLEGHVDGEITNSGTIEATATGTSSVLAAGINIGGDFEGFIDSSVGGVISNSGTITVDARGDEQVDAAGIILFGTLYDGGGTPAVPDDPETTETDESVPAVMGGVISNSGTIEVEARGESGSAVGILVQSMEDGSTVINEVGGMISAEVRTDDASSETSAIAAGIWINAMAAGATLTNAGTVTATSRGDNAQHWSMRVDDGGGNTITNSGNIIGQMNFVNASLDNTGRATMPEGDVGMISDDYTQMGTGDLELGVLSASAGDYGQLVVGGTADISANDLLAVDVNESETLMDDDVIEDVLSAGTLVHNGGLTVTDNTLLWDFTAVDDGNNNIDLLTNKSLEIALAGDAGPKWAQPAANTLEDLAYSWQLGDELLGGLTGANAAGNLSGALAQAVPVLVGQSANAANLSVTDAKGAVAGRIASRRGMSAGDAGAEKHGWIRVFTTTAEQDDNPDAVGFEVDNSGLMIGYDQAVSDNWTVGVAFGANNPDVESDSSFINHDIDIDGYQFSLYGDWSNGDYFVDLIGVIGRNDNESERRINFGGMRVVAEGEYDSNYTMLYAAAGKTFNISDTVRISPVLSVGYAEVDEDGYVETGAGDLNLNVSSNEADSVILGLDGHLSVDIGENGSQFTAHVGVGSDSSTDDSELIARFVTGGPAFLTSSEEPDEFVYRAGIGFGLFPRDDVEIHFTYEFEGRDDFSNQLLSATARWRF